ERLLALDQPDVGRRLVAREVDDADAHLLEVRVAGDRIHRVLECECLKRHRPLEARGLAIAEDEDAIRDLVELRAREGGHRRPPTVIVVVRRRIASPQAAANSCVCTICQLAAPRLSVANAARYSL